MKIAVAGCLHGELNKIYDDIQRRQDPNDPVKLLLVCGDFQSLRNANDFKCLAVPPKYQVLGDFHEYYSGKRTAPVLTLFVGGNHEASNYLATLAFGGWIAKNIYYMGYSSVVQFGGLRIAGISGIYKRHHSTSGHHESLPFDNDSMRSIYHTREVDVYRLMQIEVTPENQQPIDIVLSHDWPLNIHTCGDVAKLLRIKPHFKSDIHNNHLGNPLYQPVIPYLKPRFWFSAHLHVKFDANINHGDGITTFFMSLDKPIPRRQYLELMDIPPPPGMEDAPLVLSHDLEWLSILQKTNRFTSIDRNPNPKVPGFTTWGFETKRFVSTPEDFEKIADLFQKDLKIPECFKMSEPVIGDEDSDPGRTRNLTNYQTDEFCSKLKINDPMRMIVDRKTPKPNPDQINLDDEEDEEEEYSGDQQLKKLKPDEDVPVAGQMFVIDKVGKR